MARQLCGMFIRIRSEGCGMVVVSQLEVCCGAIIYFMGCTGYCGFVDNIILQTVSI